MNLLFFKNHFLQKCRRKSLFVTPKTNKECETVLLMLLWIYNLWKQRASNWHACSTSSVFSPVQCTWSACCARVVTKISEIYTGLINLVNRSLRDHPKLWRIPGNWFMKLMQFCILDVENYFAYFSRTIFVNDSVNFFLRVKSHLKYCHFRKWTCWLLLKAEKLCHLNYTLEICLYKVIWILVFWSFHWILAVEFSTSAPSLAFWIPLQHAWVMHQYLSWVGSPFISRDFFLPEFKWCSLNQDGLLLFLLVSLHKGVGCSGAVRLSLHS